MTRILKFTAPTALHPALIPCLHAHLRITAGLGPDLRGFDGQDVLKDRIDVSSLLGGTEKIAEFQGMHTDPKTLWVDYDVLLQNMGHWGALSMRAWFEGLHRDQATNKVLLGAPSGLGPGHEAKLVRNIPGVDVPLLFLTVEDLVAGGYKAPASGDTAPVPEPEPPAPVPEVFPHTGGRWIYLSCSTQAFNEKFNALPESKRNNIAAKYLTCLKPAGFQWPCWLVWCPAYDADQHSIWSPAHVTTAEPTWTNAQKSTAVWPLP